jgi:hypothetical protein
MAVTVTYADRDHYDLVVGTVFKPDCANLNLQQVALGSAWYDEAYRCEIDSRNAPLWQRLKPRPRPQRWAYGLRPLWPHGLTATVQTPKCLKPAPRAMRQTIQWND